MSANVEVPTLAHKPSHSSNSLDEKAKSSDDGSLEVAKKEEGVDVVVDLIADHGEENLDGEEARKLRSKLDWNLLPLLFCLYTLQFVDKNALGASAILGILPDNKLTPNQFNNLGSAFYIGYIIFVYPHSWMMQRFPISKYISANIFFWAICIGLMPACKNYGGLFALRFLLGASEGCITTGIMTIISMFYNRVEIAERIGWTFQCSGIAAILSSFIAFGVAHIGLDKKPAPWKYYMIIIAIVTLLISILWFWQFPDNPNNARFLNGQQKTDVVKRIRANQNGIESKVWKWYQFVEAFKDPKTYIFFFFAIVADLVGGIGIQYSIIIKGYGFTTLQTTLLNIPTGVGMILSITLGGMFVRWFPNSRTYIGAAAWVPGVVGAICLITLPLSNRNALLAQIYIVQLIGPGMVMMLSLCATSNAGHTKKMTVNAIFLVGYALGQIVATQFWKDRYRPRNTVPWIILLCSYCFDIAITLFLRWYLVRENRRRDKEQAESGKEYEEFGYVETTDAEGKMVKVKVPIQFMDITDWENKAFRYPL